MALTCALSVAACGDSDDSDEASSTQGAPSISGAPPPQVAVGNEYSFRPTASDPDGDTLTFSVANLPAWASFNAATGAITGTPDAGDVGIYSNIRISVNDGASTASLTAFSISVVAIGNGTATLSWMPPTLNTDGSAFTDPDGYKIYWGPSEGNYTHSVRLGTGITRYVVEGLTPGTWYFAATAVNSIGVESSFSNIASKSIL